MLLVSLLSSPPTEGWRKPGWVPERLLKLAPYTVLPMLTRQEVMSAMTLKWCDSSA